MVGSKRTGTLQPMTNLLEKRLFAIEGDEPDVLGLRIQGKQLCTLSPGSSGISCLIELHIPRNYQPFNSNFLHQISGANFTDRAKIINVECQFS